MNGNSSINYAFNCELHELSGLRPVISRWRCHKHGLPWWLWKTTSFFSDIVRCHSSPINFSPAFFKDCFICQPVRSNRSDILFRSVPFHQARSMPRKLCWKQSSLWDWQESELFDQFSFNVVWCWANEHVKVHKQPGTGKVLWCGTHPVLFDPTSWMRMTWKVSGCKLIEFWYDLSAHATRRIFWPKTVENRPYRRQHRSAWKEKKAMSSPFNTALKRKSDLLHLRNWLFRPSLPFSIFVTGSSIGLVIFINLQEAAGDY